MSIKLAHGGVGSLERPWMTKSGLHSFIFTFQSL